VWERQSSRIDIASVIELTRISSIAINFLLQEFSKADDIGIAFIYFDHKRTITPDEIVGSVIKHLMHRNTNPSKELINLYSEHMERSTRPTYTELTKILEIESRSVSQVFIVFDALDECPVQYDTRTKIVRYWYKSAVLGISVARI
jgi:hypothetical protein